MFVPDDLKLYLLGFMNSCVAQFYLNLVNPTINFLINDILSLPVIVEHKEDIEVIVRSNLSISKMIMIHLKYHMILLLVHWRILPIKLVTKYI